jgi:UrcA family protein
MRISPLMASALGAALAVGVCGFKVPSASAQDYGPAYESGPPESVIVTAPRIHIDSHKLNGPLERVSMSTAVRYDDLDLGTWDGEHELRRRIRDEAHNICDRLADAYPFYQLQGEHCFRTAVNNAMAQANVAIYDARLYNAYFTELQQ